MATKIDTGLGKIAISDEVIAIVAGVATTECYGLVGMASRKFQDGIAELLGRDSLSKGVVVKLADDDAVEIDLYIIVEYGVNILEVARNVMDKVRYTIENTLGLKVKDVNINVQGIRYREKNVAKDGAL